LQLVKEKEVLINRKQMIDIARKYNIFTSIGTIHRWANEPDFPLAIGKNGKHLIYSQSDFVNFLKQKLHKIQAEH